MKKLTGALLCLVLSLCLTGCIVNTAASPYDPSLVDRLMESDAFSEPLEPLDADLIWILYDMDASGVLPADLTDAAGCCSAGATCEQAVVLCFSTQVSADAAREHMDRYLSAQIDANRSYRPAEVPKLEKAILSQRENTLLLLVADNYDEAAALINE